MRFGLRSLVIAILCFCAAVSLFCGIERKTVVVQTGDPMDVAVVGEGFFEVVDVAQGRTYYTRTGRLDCGTDDLLAIRSSTLALQPQIAIGKATEMRIKPTGEVQVTDDDSDLWVTVGQLELVRFQRPQFLAKCGQGLFRATEASGVPQSAAPGTHGLGLLCSGWLEQPRVIVDERAMWVASFAIFFSVSMIVSCILARPKEKRATSKDLDE